MPSTAAGVSEVFSSPCQTFSQGCLVLLAFLPAEQMTDGGTDYSVADMLNSRHRGLWCRGCPTLPTGIVDKRGLPASPIWAPLILFSWAKINQRNQTADRQAISAKTLSCDPSSEADLHVQGRDLNFLTFQRSECFTLRWNYLWIYYICPMGKNSKVLVRPSAWIMISLGCTALITWHLDSHHFLGTQSINTRWVVEAQEMPTRTIYYNALQRLSFVSKQNMNNTKSATNNSQRTQEKTKFKSLPWHSLLDRLLMKSTPTETRRNQVPPLSTPFLKGLLSVLFISPLCAGCPRSWKRHPSPWCVFNYKEMTGWLIKQIQNSADKYESVGQALALTRTSWFSRLHGTPISELIISTYLTKLSHRKPQWPHNL